MARSNDKELLQCLAFAFFAAHPNHADKSHPLEWEDVFQPYITKDEVTLVDGAVVPRDTILKREMFALLPQANVIRKRRQGEMVSAMERDYGKYLGRYFNYTLLVKKFALGRTKNKMTVTVPPKLKTAYKVAESFVSSNLIDNLSEYAFLDQDDPFTIRIKDGSLKKIHKLFELSGNHEILSPVDMFCVRRNMKERIEKDFETHIINASDTDLLSNMSYGTQGRNTYRTISGKYFHSRDCVGISLKFPNTIDGKKYTKIVGSVHVPRNLRSFVDPYGKLIGEMLRKDVNIEALLTKAITINFSQFRIDSSLASWEYPVTFNYNAVVDSQTKEPLHNTKLKFVLLTWAKQGFNGQWVIGGQKTTWVSGMGIGTAERVFFQYHEYRTIVDELVKIRTTIFKEMFPKRNLLQGQLGGYELALGELGTQQILVNAKMRVADKFMANDPTRTEYRVRVIRELTKRVRRNFTTINPKYVHQHFQAAQLAYFLFRAENKVNSFLKRRIFLSIFGMLNKSGYKIFETNGGKTEMGNYIKRQYQNKKKQVEAYYNAAPYILLS